MSTRDPVGVPDAHVCTLCGTVRIRIRTIRLCVNCDRHALRQIDADTTARHPDGG